MIHKDLENPHYLEWLKFLKEADSWDLARIEEYQFRQLQKRVSRIWDNLPGYRKLWQERGLSPQSLRDLDSINLFPCVDKAMIRADVEAFTDRSFPELEFTSTGGSTGVAMNFYRTPRSFGRELASKAHQYHRRGWKEGDRQIVLRGTPINTDDKTQFFPEFNELRCSSYYLTDSQMKIYWQKALEYQPQWLRCYPSAGCMFAGYLRDNKLELPALKGILVTSETLYDAQKEMLEQTFGCKVFNHYGHFELAVLAGYCEHGDSLHVLPQYGIAQLLDERDRPITQKGQIGEIVATSLINEGTEFFRYRTQDFAVYEGASCPSCGRPYQIWSRVEGRLQDFIVTDDDRYISITAVNMHNDIFSNVRHFQYYQEKPGEVVLKYIPEAKNSVVSEEKIRSMLMEKLDSHVRIIIRKVDEHEIYRTKRGKTLYMRQMLPIKKKGILESHVE